MTQAVVVFTGALKAAKYIHNSLLTSVLHWPALTFDRIPIGRIINRLGADIDVMDNTLSRDVLNLLTYAAIVSEILLQRSEKKKY